MTLTQHYADCASGIGPQSRDGRTAHDFRVTEGPVRSTKKHRLLRKEKMELAWQVIGIGQTTEEHDRGTWSSFASLFVDFVLVE